MTPLGALAKQGLSEDDIKEGDALLFRYGWSKTWSDPVKNQGDMPGTRIRRGPVGHRPKAIDGVLGRGLHGSRSQPRSQLVLSYPSSVSQGSDLVLCTRLTTRHTLDALPEPKVTPRILLRR